MKTNKENITRITEIGIIAYLGIMANGIAFYEYIPSIARLNIPNEMKLGLIMAGVLVASAGTIMTMYMIKMKTGGLK